MLHVVTKANRKMYAALLDEMHRARKTVFVDGAGWNDLIVRGDMEFDPYDDDQAEYLLGLDAETGEVRASVRMRRALDGSVLGDIFPRLVDGGRARVIGPDVWEGTRMVATPGARTDTDKKLMREIRVGMVELVLKRGGARFTGLGDVKSIPFLRTGAWIYTILGAPVSDASGDWFAFEAECTPAALERARAWLGATKPVLLELPLMEPCYAPPHEIEQFVTGINGANAAAWIYTADELDRELRKTKRSSDAPASSRSAP